MKPNNLVALLIFVILMVIGVALFITNHQSQSGKQEETGVLLNTSSPGTICV